MKRLYSTFADGWPGAGLFLQRVLATVLLLCCGITHFLETARLGLSFASVIAAVAGVFLLLGLWTPLAGTMIAIAEVWIFLAWSGSSLTPIMVAGLAGTVAMIGPGIWSIDAKLYGRKLLEDPRY